MADSRLGNKRKGTGANNAIALIAIGLIIFSIWSFWTTQKAIEITSKSVSISSGFVSFCYMTDAPNFTIIWPQKNQIVIGNVTARGFCRGCENNVSNVTYIFRKSGIETIVGITDHYEPGWYFDKKIDTVKKNLPDGNCNYFTISRVGYNYSCLREKEDLGDFFTINNVNLPPIWTNFTNSETTNFAGMSSWVNINNVVVSDGENGSIYFPEYMNFDGANLDKGISIKYNNVILRNSLRCIDLNINEKKAYVTLHNLTFFDPGIMVDGVECGSCYPYTYANYTLTFPISSVGNYTAFEAGAFGIFLLDDTMYSVKYHNQDVGFYANLTNASGRGIFYSPDVECNISFNPDLTVLGSKKMRYNSTTNLYYYSTTFIQPGSYEYRVFCDATKIDKGTMEATDMFSLENHCPRCIHSLPANFTWGKNTVLNSGEATLDDYCIDEDSDVLSYRYEPFPVENISVLINDTYHTFLIQPYSDWYGNRTISFYAKDMWCGSEANTNEVLLIVENTPPPNEKRDSSSSRDVPICLPKWECSAWSKCKPTNKMTRTCKDMNNCNASMYMPEIELNCTYTPTCNDRLKNGAETGVDCGGVCLPCPTCADGIKNQGETGVDCGGPCGSCPTCSDGMKNQFELQIDCGGPCMACPTCFDGLINQDEELTDCGGKTCDACQKEVDVQKPYFTAAFWSIFIISLLLALAIAIALRKKIWGIIKAFGRLLASLFKHKKSEYGIFETYLENLVFVLDKADEIKKTRDLEDMNDFADGFFCIVTGTMDGEKITREIQFSIFNERTRNVLLEAFNNWKAGKMEELLKNIERSAKAIFFESLNFAGLSDLELFEKSCQAIRHYSGTRREMLKKFIYEIYLRLPMDTKGKVYKSLREIDNPEQKMGKEAAFGIVLLAMLGIAIFFSFGNNLAGFSVFSLDTGILSVESNAELLLPAGHGASYLLRIFGANGTLSFSENSEIADIDSSGWLRIKPIENPGVYYVNFIASDAKNSAEGIIRIVVYK